MQIESKKDYPLTFSTCLLGKEWSVGWGGGRGVCGKGSSSSSGGGGSVAVAAEAAAALIVA